MSGRTRWLRVATVAAQIVEIALEANVIVHEVTMQAAPLAPTAEPTSYPEVVVDVRHPGDRQRLANHLGLPHPEAFPSVLGQPGRLEVYTGPFGGIRVQVLGPMPNPLADDVQANRPTARRQGNPLTLALIDEVPC